VTGYLKCKAAAADYGKAGTVSDNDVTAN